MTKEDAIDIIKSECYVFNPLNFDRSTMVNTALDMAITSLERSDKFQQKAEVVISQLRADRDRLEDAIEKIRAEITEYGSIWVQYTIKGRTDKDIDGIVENAIKQAKDQVLYIIDKHTKEREK